MHPSQPQPPVVPAIPHGEAGIQQVGHRAYVGGLWEELGRLQRDFLVAQGLQPEHYLLDVGCGSLRGGVHFITYLQPGHYLGIDKEPLLLEAGLREEVGAELFARKKPRLHLSANFDATVFGVAAHYALAQSLFTHLPAWTILACLRRLRPCLRPGGLFFATFFESAVPRANPRQPHDHGYFAYTRKEMELLGRHAGWGVEYVGVWGHPRGQRMMKFCVEP